MATINTSQYLDSGTARTAGEAHIIGSGATLTIRTDSRIHANAPASFTGSLGSPTFTGIGGELLIDARNVRWMAFSGVTAGNVPAIGTTISQGGVSGYLLGVWSSISAAPTAVGAACPASGFIKMREVTGGTFAAGAITGLATNAVSSGPDVTGWIEIVWDAAVNFVVGRVGSFKTRGGWFEIGTTNGSVGQAMTVPSTSSTIANNYLPGCWVERYDGAHEALGEVDGYEFWPGLSSAANGWIKTALGFAEGYTDKRGQFCKTFAGGQIVFGETATMTGTYATVAGQASTYVGIALSCSYVWANDEVIVSYTSPHLFNTGQTVYVDFTTGGGTPDGNYVVTILDAYVFKFTLAGSGTAGNCTVRPGVIVTFTAHGLHEGESIYADFTTGTGVDGTYKIYAVTGANTYNIEYPHSAALTSGNVTANHTLQATITAHGMATGNDVYFDFTSGTGVDGRYILKAVAANTMNINYPFVTGAGPTGNVTARWTIGHIPPANCRVKVSNILWSECATGARATNTVPNATIASRPEFTTTTAGAIDLESIYTLSGRAVFAQPYSVRIVNSALSETLDISECATALDINNVGVGQYSAQDARAIQLTSNFAGGTVNNVWAFRALVGTNDHASDFTYCVGQTSTNFNTGIINYTRSSGIPLNLVGSQSLTFNGLSVFNGNIPIATSKNITFNNLDYNDRIIGVTTAVTPYYCFTIAAGCSGITIDGVTFGKGNTIPDCHPFNGILNPTGASNIKLRNVGSSESYLNNTNWAPNYSGMGYVFASGGNNDNIKIQKVFLKNVRTGLFSTINSDKNVLFEQVLTNSPYIHSAKTARTEVNATLNAYVKGITSGLETAAGQTSVYGTHWLAQFRGEYLGHLILMMNEPTVETVPYFSNPAGVVKFNSAGGVEMRAIGAEAIWETPYFIKGYSAFPGAGLLWSIAMVGGGSIANFTITYQIDTGSGYGAWTALTQGNLATHTLTSTGFRLKIKIVTAVTNTAAITLLRIPILTTAAAQNAIDYPLDTNNASFTGLPTGTDVVVLTAGSNTILDQRDSLASSSYTYTYSGAQSVDVGFIKPGYVPFYIRNLSLGLADSSIPVSLVVDRNYQ